MMKNVFYVCLLTFIFLIVGCGEKYDFKEMEIVAKSSYSTDTFSITCPASDLGDGEETTNFFLSNLDFEKMSERFVTHENYISHDANWISFFSGKTYFTLIYVEEKDGYYEYKLKSEYSTFRLDTRLMFLLPFPYALGSFSSLSVQYDASDFAVLKDYYGRLNFSWVIVEDSKIVISNLPSSSSTRDLYELTFELDGESVNTSAKKVEND